MALLTRGFPTACLLSNKQLLVHQKAIKALHTLFDMEVGAVDVTDCPSHNLFKFQGATPHAACSFARRVSCNNAYKTSITGAACPERSTNCCRLSLAAVFPHSATTM
jgi:hypothetical protein